MLEGDAADACARSGSEGPGRAWLELGSGSGLGWEGFGVRVRVRVTVRVGVRVRVMVLGRAAERGGVGHHRHRTQPGVYLAGLAAGQGLPEPDP